MLILTRKVGESIIVGNDVVVTVEGIERGKVKLSFDAPQEVTIHRKEVRDRLQQDQK